MPFSRRDGAAGTTAGGLHNPLPLAWPGIPPASPGLCHPQVRQEAALAARNAILGAAVPWQATKFGIRLGICVSQVGLGLEHPIPFPTSRCAADCQTREMLSLPFKII